MLYICTKCAMKFIKIFITVLSFLIIVAGLFLLFIFSTRYQPEKMEDINPRYANKPPYLLQAKNAYAISSWNIGAAVSGVSADAFAEGGNMSRPKKDSVSAWMSEIKSSLTSMKEKADFILLQDVDINSSRSNATNQFREIWQLFENQAFSVAINHNVPHVPIPFLKPYGRLTTGMGIISDSYPLESIRYDFGKGGAFPYHLFTQDNCCIINDYRLRNGKTLVVINVQNGTFGLKEPRTDIIQSLMALMVTEYEQGNYVIAGGDWALNPPAYEPSSINTQDSTTIVSTVFLPEYLPEGWIVAYDEQTPTSRSMDSPYQKGTTPTTITDFFIASPNVLIKEVETISLNFKSTSHNPIRITFGLK